MSDKIVISCVLSIGYPGANKSFQLRYDPEDFEGMAPDEIKRMVEDDAYDQANEYVSVSVTLPEGLGE